MKRIVLLLSFILMIGINVGYSQSDDPTTLQETERLVDKYSQKIEASITSLANTLQEPAEHVYEVLVQQQVVYAWAWLWIFIAWALLSSGLTIGAVIDRNGDEWWGVPAASWIILIILLSIGLDTCLSGFFNPEYGAIRDIGEFIKQ